MARKALGPATVQVVRAVRTALGAGSGGRILVGCSGGSDSLALAVAAHEVIRRAGRLDRLGAVVVDHDLQEGSDRVAAEAAAALRGLGYPDGSVRVVRVRVDPERARRDGPEAAARTARYAAFEDGLAPADRVLLAHTRDDQAETVLLGIVRGSGVRSLAGIPPRRGPYVRPLLGLSRATLRECCREQGLTWWDDPHNADLRYARVRIRARVLPVLEAEFGGTGSVAEALARTAALARADADLLDELAAAAEPDVVRGETLDCDALAGLPEALRGRVIRRWLIRRGSSGPGQGHVAAVEGLVTGWHGQDGIDVPGLTVVRRDGALVGVPS